MDGLVRKCRSGCVGSSGVVFMDDWVGLLVNKRRSGWVRQLLS